jgi:GNAT superfamily N-acetyltransferase
MSNSHQTSGIGAATAPSLCDGPSPAAPLRLANGACLCLRSIAPSDAERLAALFARLSPTSRYRRYFSPKRDLSSRELTYLTQLDHVRHEAVAAVDPTDGSIVGVARYVQHRDCPKVAELAFEVADEFQSLGVGSALGRSIVQRARENGFAGLTAMTLSDNRAARALLGRLKFQLQDRHGPHLEMALELSQQASALVRPV